MSTLAEIEKAIEALPEPQVSELAGWPDRLRQHRAIPPAEPYHDLDALVGSWQEDPAFDAAVRTFRSLPSCTW